MFWRCLFLTLAFLHLLAPPARAADKAWEDCDQTADQDRKIAGCTQVLARGAAESETNRANAYVNRGYAYGTSDNDRAILDFDEAIRLDPKAVRAYNARGGAYFKKVDNDRAIKDYDEAIRLNPQYALAYTGRGKVYHSKGDNDRAIRDHDEAVRLYQNLRMPIAIAAMPTPTRAITTAPSGITTKQSGSIRSLRRPTSIAGKPTPASAITTAPSRITARRSASIPKMRAPICIAGAPTSSRTITTAPSRSTTRRSASIRNMRSPMRFAGEPMKTRETHPGQEGLRRGGAAPAESRTNGADPRECRRIQQSRTRLLRKGRLRPRHQRFRRGYLPRSEKCDGL